MGVKISELTEASAAQSTDVMPIVQNGETKKIPVSVLLANLQTQLGDLESHVNDEIYFKSGDSYTFAAIECAGHLTSAQKTIQFSIVMPKRMDNVNISSISLTGLIRSSAGGYINSSDPFNFANYGTLAPSIRGNIISINYNLNTATSFANNTLVACWISGTVNFE